ALVAELRVAAADTGSPPARRRGAATQLARLAKAGVPGADPAGWWGLAAISDERPLVDPGATGTVTPSTVEGVQRCSLPWLLHRHGGSSARSPEQSVGDLVHEIAQRADEPRAHDGLTRCLDH